MAGDGRYSGFSKACKRQWHAAFDGDFQCQSAPTLTGVVFLLKSRNSCLKPVKKPAQADPRLRLIVDDRTWCLAIDAFE